MILDTSFLVDVMNSDVAALDRVDELDADGIEQNVPAMTLQELYIGIGATDLSESERQKVEYVVESRPILPTTEALARKAGRIDGQHREQGERALFNGSKSSALRAGTIYRLTSNSRDIPNILGSEAGRVRCANHDVPLHRTDGVARSKSRRWTASSGLSPG